MLVYVAQGMQSHERVFLDAWVVTLGQLGHTCVRKRVPNAEAAVVWNGRGYQPACPTIYCELGWLPRWSYQVSYKGINADHHAAGLYGCPEGNGQGALEAVHAGNPWKWQYTSLTPDIVWPTALPERYWLVPLQVESDTNMQHVPEALRSMQGFVDAVCAMGLDAPMVFKRHPAVKGRRHPYVHEAMYLPSGVTVYDALASGRVRGVITLNSNTCNDALAYGVPSVVVADGIWPRRTGPFFRSLPETFSMADFLAWEASAERIESARHYMCQLDAVQWSVNVAQNKDAVAEMLAAAQEDWAANPRTISDRAIRDVVNVVASDRGWLFEDLKQRWAVQGSAQADIVCTEEPIEATAWVYMRPEECASSPDPTRTVVQMHDLLWEQPHKDPIERAKKAAFHASRIAAAKDVRGWAFNHPRQIPYVHSQLGYMPPQFMVRPLGCASYFTPRHELNPERVFRVGWVGRNGSMKGLDWLIPAWIEAAKDIPGMTCVLLGEQCEYAYAQLCEAGVVCDYLHKDVVGGHKGYPAIYRGCDVVCVASATESQPFPLFEALACGVPVVSTMVGWAPMLVHAGLSGHIVRYGDGQAVVAALKEIHTHREVYFARRLALASLVGPYTLEDWFDLQTSFALRVAQGG